MFKKLLQWLRKSSVVEAEEAVADEIEDADNIFPDAETLRQETLEKTPFITDEQLLSRIRRAQKEHDNFAWVSNFRISDESIAKLKKRGISVDIWTVSVGFDLKWH